MPCVSARPVSVLVVDDHAAFRVAARELLEPADGFSLAGEAATGEEAVILAATLRPSLVLMDVRLPGIDGIDATRQLLAAAPATVVVLCSTYHPADLPPGAGTCGAAGYVRKEELAPGLLRSIWEGRTSSSDASPASP